MKKEEKREREGKKFKQVFLTFLCYEKESQEPEVETEVLIEWEWELHHKHEWE